MLGIAASTWNVSGISLGLIGALILFFFGMPHAVRTGGAPIVVANPTPEGIAEERRNLILGYIGLVLTVAGAGCGIVGSLS